MSWNQYRKTFEHHFPPGVMLDSVHGGGVRVSVPCKHPRCQPEPVEFKQHMPADRAKKVFTNRGWRFWGKATTCPEHSKKKDEPMNDNQSKARLTPVQRNAQASDLTLAAAEPVASVAAREGTLMAIMLLMDKFDAAKGAYKDSYNDLKVAKECGISEAKVAEERERLFGPIKEPAEITELRERCSALQAKIDDFEHQANASHAAALEVLTTMKAECSKMTGRLAAVVQRNGW